MCRKIDVKICVVRKTHWILTARLTAGMRQEVAIHKKLLCPAVAVTVTVYATALYVLNNRTNQNIIV